VAARLAETAGRPQFDRFQSAQLTVSKTCMNFSVGFSFAEQKFNSPLSSRRNKLDGNIKSYIEVTLKDLNKAEITVLISK